MQNKHLVFIVAYCAEAHIRELFERIHSSGLDTFADVLLIDDASPDKTAALARSHAQSLKCKVTILRNPINLGYGGNQKLGYEYAIREGYQTVTLLHGDCQYPPESIKALIAPIAADEADVVFGSRMLNKADALAGGMPLYKWVGNQITTGLQNWLLGSQLSECHSGFRAYRVSVLKSVPFRYNADDFHFDADIIIQCHRIGARIHEIPIPTRYASEVCRVNGLSYCWNCLKSGIADRCTQMEIFYSRKFDLQSSPLYESKIGLLGSSHEMALTMVPPGSSVTDLGGGNGAVATQLAKNKCRVTIVDPYPKIASTESVEVITSRIEDLQAIPASDVVLLLDVIEHLPRQEHFKILQKIRDMGGGRTKVVVSVPNSLFLPVRLMMLFGRINYGRRGILDETHSFLFTRHSLTQLLTSAGYRIGTLRGTTVPFAFALKKWPWLADCLAHIQRLMASVLPGLFSYQFVVDAYPQPTVAKLLIEAEHAPL